LLESHSIPQPVEAKIIEERTFFRSQKRRVTHVSAINGFLAPQAAVGVEGDFLSRYTPGGAMSARYEALSIARFPGMQPFGMYPIHIIVKNRRTTLLGVVDSEIDRNLAGVRARDVTGVFSVENDLVVEKR